MSGRVWAGRVEALCMLGLAGVLFWLLVGGEYWMYLNPRFRPISWAAAVALAGLGAFSLWRAPSGASWGRAGLFALVLALWLVGQFGLERGMARLGLDPQGLSQSDEAPALAPRVVKRGVEYVRINLGELFDIAENAKGAPAPGNWAVRGFVRRSPEMDARGEFVLYRLALYCCLADSTAVGFRVRMPQGEALPDNGSWAVVYGELAPARDTEPAATEQSLGGSAFASINDGYVISGKLLEKEKPEGMGMMYEWRSQEPYAY
uniref:DUF1980 domain-containing protein n=1 Tax=Fundidesulfovibrio putealis TaxID=270496 RepID=A0A7C4EM00_9BACT